MGTSCRGLSGFCLHDSDGDDSLSSNDIVDMSETFLFLARHEDGDQFLSSVSTFINNCFEYAEREVVSTNPGSTPISTIASVMNIDERTSALKESGLRMSLPSFRMVVLADEMLEVFFDSRLANSFKLAEPIVERQKSFGREIFDVFWGDSLKMASRAGARVLGPSGSSQQSLAVPSKQTPITDSDIINGEKNQALESKSEAALDSPSLTTTEKSDDENENVLEEVDQLLSEYGHDNGDEEEDLS